MDISPLRAGTLARMLADKAFFASLPSDIFRQGEQNAQLVEMTAGEELVPAGDSAPFSWFLVDGTLSLDGADSGALRELSAADSDAGYPVANLRPTQYRVIAVDDCQLVRFEHAYIRSLVKAPPPARFLGGSEIGGGSWQSEAYAIEALQLAHDGEFEVPSMPGISARIHDTIVRDDFSIEEVARLISADPSIAGGLINLANSALFAGRDKVTTLERAVVRLGVKQTHTLVMTLATKALFTARQPWLKQRLKAIWRHAVDMGAYAAVLAGLSPRLDKAQAMLLGLLHEIGAIPLLELADGYVELEAKPGVLDAVLANVAPELSARTLVSWGLDEFAEAARHQENWYYDHPDELNYTDVLVVSHLHGLMKAREFANLPRLDETHAWQRMAALGLTAAKSVEVFADAADELAQLRALLY